MGKFKGSLRLRLGVLRKVLFGHHWMLISLSDENLECLFKDRSFDVDAEYLGLRKYIINKMLYKLSEGIDDESLLLNRMEFEMEVEQYSKLK